MFMGDKKKLGQIIVAKFKAPEDVKAGPEDKEDPKKELKMIAEEILQAIETKDVDALVDSLCAFDDLYDDYQGERPEEESEEEGPEEHKILG